MNNILSQIKSHATIIIGDVVIYNNLKQEIVNSNFLCINFDYEPQEKGEKTLKLSNLEEIKNFLQNKSSDMRYVVTNRNMRLTGLQNAMLKMLEEATENTKIIFVVDSVSYFLPTVLSRMQIINSNSFEVKETQDKNNKNIQSNQNIFSPYKKKLILAKDFTGLEKILQVESLDNMGLIPEKQLGDYLALI